jgi:hypothetical protein
MIKVKPLIKELEKLYINMEKYKKTKEKKKNAHV